MTISKCGSTGNNYTYHSRSDCHIVRLPETWLDEAIARQVSSHKQRRGEITLKVDNRVTMERRHIIEFGNFNDMTGRQDSSVPILMSWYFLFRVPSEALPLEAGRPEELVALALTRHSAVVVAF